MGAMWRTPMLIRLVIAIPKYNATNAKIGISTFSRLIRAVHNTQRTDATVSTRNGKEVLSTSVVGK